MTYDKICLMLPTYGRSKTSLPVFIQSAIDTCNANICFAFCVNENDAGTIEFLNNFDFAGHEYIVVYENLYIPHLAKYFNMLYAAVSDKWSGAVVSMLGDDMVFLTDGWDTTILKHVNKHHGIGVFWCNDDYIAKDQCAVNLFVTQDFVRLTDSLFMCEEFAAEMIDLVWTMVGVYTYTAHYLPGVVIRHNHYTRYEVLDDTAIRLHEIQKSIHGGGGNTRSYIVAAKIARKLNENGLVPQMYGLDILVCSLDSRKEMLKRLLDRLVQQCREVDGGKFARVLVTSDNGEMNIGEKRNFLLAQSNRKYVVFVDDDDMVSTKYVELIHDAIVRGEKEYGTVDCISSCGYIVEDGAPSKKFEISKKYKEWKVSGDGTYLRTPNHISVVSSRIAKKAWFPELMHGEDKVYSDRIFPYLKNEVRIDEPLYYYIYWNKTTGMYYSQNDEEKYIIDACTRGGEYLNGRFLDIGAYDGRTFSNTLRLYERGWSGVLFEPSPCVFKALEKQYAGCDRVQLVMSAVGVESGLIDFYDSNGEPLSTTSLKHLDKWNQTKFTKTRVPCMTWNDLFNGYGADFSFVNIDTESTNYELLQVFPFDRCKPECMCIEYDDKLDGITEIMTQNGYQRIHVTSENAIYTLVPESGDK